VKYFRDCRTFLLLILYLDVQAVVSYVNFDYSYCSCTCNGAMAEQDYSLFSACIASLGCNLKLNTN
jgi:hypothetical protein